MTIKVGINGFGRIGRLALRAAWSWPEFEFVQINDPAGDAATHAHLLNFDSVHGRWNNEADAEGDQHRHRRQTHQGDGQQGDCRHRLVGLRSGD